MSRQSGLGFKHETQRGHSNYSSFLKKHAKKQKHLPFRREKKEAILLLRSYLCVNVCSLSGPGASECKCVTFYLCVCVVAVHVPPTLPGGCKWHGAPAAAV